MKLIKSTLKLSFLALILILSSCNSAAPETDTENQEIIEEVPVQESTVDTSIQNSTEANSTTEANNTKPTVVTINTSLGAIKVQLYDETPLHKANFIKLCKTGFYNGLLFHRVISQFMIQAGDPDSKAAVKGAMYGSGGPGYTIPAEINPKFQHTKGALAAARMGDQMNPKKESSGSQFYICHVETPFLNNEYTVFGQTIEGFEVIDKIANVQKDGSDRPLQDIKIISTTVE
ncbi:MAG: peptidylprolyl isomerase [Bacteroidota bacterium]|nr:peptidylprolyl isomerase [Bacteroidota bacterium]